MVKDIKDRKLEFDDIAHYQKKSMSRYQKPTE
jgi:hypothetical protein